MPLIVHAPSSAVALSSPAALVGSRDGIDVGVDVGRFVAVVGSRDGIDVGVDVGTFVGADSGDVGNIEQAQHWELSEQYATFLMWVTQ